MFGYKNEGSRSGFGKNENRRGSVTLISFCLKNFGVFLVFSVAVYCTGGRMHSVAVREFQKRNSHTEIDKLCLTEAVPVLYVVYLVPHYLILCFHCTCPIVHFRTDTHFLFPTSALIFIF
jgi:hypothetical protein